MRKISVPVTKAIVGDRGWRGGMEKHETVANQISMMQIHESQIPLVPLS